MIHENPETNYNGEDIEDFNFELLPIKCATLSRIVYGTDTYKVNQPIHEYFLGRDHQHLDQTHGK